MVGDLLGNEDCPGRTAHAEVGQGKPEVNGKEGIEGATKGTKYGGQSLKSSLIYLISPAYL